MSLTKQIEAFRADFLPKVPEAALEMMNNATAELEASDITDAAPKTGDQLPGFSLHDQNGQIVTLGALLTDGPVILTFYRGGWCPYCNLELKAYQDILEEINALGATLVAITPEQPDASLTTAEKNALQFRVLSDEGAAYARSLNLVFTLPESLRQIYQNFGIQVEAHNGVGQFDLPLAATYVVSQSGEIVQAFVDADYTRRQEPSVALEALKAL